MCGIAGWFRRTGKPVSEAVIGAQCDSILHRGPDDVGILIDGDFGFGMRRLSIVDVEGGHQPIFSTDGRFAIIFNGEIYNHLEVRREIGERYAFTSRSDTETILAAFSLWGNDTWKRLEGMFAVALWDRHARTLTLVRDPLGIKPLYISRQNGGIAFASELKAILLLPGHEFNIDLRAIDDYFTFGHVRRPRTIYREVETLDPGSYLTIAPGAAEAKVRYWQPKYRAEPARSEGEWIETMRAMLEATTASHLMADVPVAALLSGGVDSSTILAAMVRANRSPVQAFTISHPGHGIDESAAAAQIARHLGCEHVVMPLVDTEAIAELPRIAACYDEPFADMAAIPTWFVSKLAAQKVKVVLCGEGGDELFYGYKRHRNARLIAKARPLLAAAGPICAIAGRLPHLPGRHLSKFRQYADRLGDFAAARDGYQQFFLATQICSERVRSAVFSDSLERIHRGPAELEEEYFATVRAGARSTLDEFVYADLSLNLPSDMLTRLDRASMAHSLEARVPFLSHRMVDWALGVPAGMKLREGVGKYILREAASPWLPREILKLPKQGFQIPMASWLKGSFGEHAWAIWNDSGAKAAGYLNEAEVGRLYAEHRSGKADHSRLLYALLTFCYWWASKPSVEPGRLCGDNDLG